jgi:hypothetical protein
MSLLSLCVNVLYNNVMMMSPLCDMTAALPMTTCPLADVIYLMSSLRMTFSVIMSVLCVTSSVALTL